MGDHPEHCPALQALQHQKSICNTEYVVHTSDGRDIILNTSYTPLLFEGNSSPLVLAVMRDITQQKHREQQLVQQAVTDPLTGLLNQRSFMAACQQELQRAMRYTHPLAVAMIDLDRFKAFSDRHGHLAGSVLLRNIARALQAACRNTETLARYGGDEFALLLPETTGVGAMKVAERLQQATAEHGRLISKVLPQDWVGNAVTASIGVVVFPKDGQTVEALLAQADHRLYEAKHLGGNQVVGPEPTTMADLAPV